MEYIFSNSPNVKPSVLISALLHMTIETDETTDKLNAPIVPSWNFWLSLIFRLLSVESCHDLDSAIPLTTVKEKKNKKKPSRGIDYEYSKKKKYGGASRTNRNSPSIAKFGRGVIHSLP